MYRWLCVALAFSAACVDLTVPRELKEYREDALLPSDDDGGVGDPGGAVDAALLGSGKRCSAAGQCLSGACVDGFCCDGACYGVCEACNLAGAEGTCQPVPAGQDPREQCPQDPMSSCARDGTCDGRRACRRYPAGTECAAGRCTDATEYAASICDGNGTCQPGSSRSCAPRACNGASCGETCASQSDCQAGFFCDGNRCALRRALGGACTAGSQCASGYCVDGVCCGTPCNESCYACNLGGGKAGTCTAVADGEDPGGDCPAEAPATCGRAGGCNGRGACRLQPAGVACAPGGCSGWTETGPGACNGAGVCAAPASRDCAPYLCSGAACGTSCTSSDQCKGGNYCAAGGCVPLTRPALHWRFDEASGSTAQDASGNNWRGTYTGVTGTPAPSSMVPSVHFSDPASRAFVAANRQAVVLSPSPAALRPANNFSVSLWYRTTLLDLGHNPPAASEALSNGDNYFLRVRASDIAFTRQTASGYVVCFAAVSNHLDGAWHHVAGVATPSGTHVYFDGVEKCANTSGGDAIYTHGQDLWVGRHGDGSDKWDFDGNIDDVRIYTRALSAEEVAAIAAGY
jgi:hypothetical protein